MDCCKATKVASTNPNCWTSWFDAISFLVPNEKLRNVRQNDKSILGNYQEKWKMHQPFSGVSFEDLVVSIGRTRTITMSAFVFKGSSYLGWTTLSSTCVSFLMMGLGGLFMLESISTMFYVTSHFLWIKL